MITRLFECQVCHHRGTDDVHWNAGAQRALLVCDDVDECVRRYRAERSRMVRP